MAYQRSSSYYQNSFGGGEYVLYTNYDLQRKNNEKFNIYSLSVATDGYDKSNLQGSYSSYELASTAGYGVEGGLGLQGLSGTSFTNGSGGYNSSSFGQQSSSLTATYAADGQGFYQDPNPQIIRRPAIGGNQTYTQRVTVKFLQPPPVPPPGVSIPMNKYL